MTTPQPVQQYDYESAQRVSLATQETAPGLADDPALQEERTDLLVNTANLQWPLLTWRDKDRNPAAYAGSLFIHEKVSPAQIIAGLMKDPASQQMDWFHDFNNLPQDAHFEPYQHHQGNWSNRLIRGASQRVMSSLLNKEGMASQVDLIYMDPPYGINFRSNFQPLVEVADVGEDWDNMPQDLRQVQAFRDTYKDGIHSYLTQLRTNVLLAKDLLKETGNFVLQIGPENLAYATLVLDEVFGHENRVVTIPYITSVNQSVALVTEVNNWLVWYAKDKSLAKIHQIYLEMDLKERIEGLPSPKGITHQDGTETPLTRQHVEDPSTLPPNSKVWGSMPIAAQHPSEVGRSDTFRYHPGAIPCRQNGWTKAQREKFLSQHTCDPDHFHPSRGKCDQPLPENWDEHTCSPKCHTYEGTRKCPKGRKCGPQCHANAYPCPTDRQWSVSLAGLHSIAAQGRANLDNPNNLTWKRYTDDMPGKRVNAVWTDSGRVTNKRYAVETPPTVLERVLLMTTDPGDLVLDPTCGSGAMPYQCETYGRRWIAIDSGATSIAIARERIATAIHPYHILKDSLEGQQKDHDQEQALFPKDKRTKFHPKPAYGNDPSLGFVNHRQTRVSAKTVAIGPDLTDPNDVIRHPDRTVIDRTIRRVSSAFTVESDMPFSAITLTEDGEAIEPANAETAGKIRANLEEAIQASGIRVPGQAEPYKVRDLQEVCELPDATHTGQIQEPDTKDWKPAVFYFCQEDQFATPIVGNALTQTAVANGCAYAVVAGFGHEGDIQSSMRRQGRVNLIYADASRDLTQTEVANKKSDQAFVVISQPTYTVHHEDSSQFSIEVKGLTVYNPKSGQVEQANDRKIAAILTDTNYDLQSFKAALFNLPNAKDQNLKQLQDAFRREISPEKWQRMRSARTLPFSWPTGGKVALKVVDHTGVEHLTVLDQPA